MLRKEFSKDPKRAEKFTYKCADLTVDLSKNLIDKKTIELLLKIAKDKNLKENIVAQFSGKHINNTEDRAVLHTALRRPASDKLVVDGVDVVKQVHNELNHMFEFANKVISGKHTGYTGKKIDTVVNIGIGGSNLGPLMVYTALRNYRNHIKAKFISNIDPSDTYDNLSNINPETTLFVIASKTFTTLETMTNAKICKDWLLKTVPVKDQKNAIKKHFIAISTALDKVKEFGIDTDNAFIFWDWVGGRYSVDSAIGMSVLLTIGPNNFTDFLDGFHKIDEHFYNTDFEKNVPVLMGLLSFYYIEVLKTTSRAVLPYCKDLEKFPAYLQQLTMESNGKSVEKNGKFVKYQTGDVYWGEPGTDGQHAFYQLLHQGTQIIPCDFIGFKHSNNDITVDGKSVHNLFMSNFFAQTQALAFGKTADEVRESGVKGELVNHKVFKGNKPTTSILADKVSPSVLGQLIALYEHITFVCGVIWEINSFDQWGVQLGKELASKLAPALDGKRINDNSTVSKIDSSTNNLIKEYLS
jgi:glucose-6-phosphate isomerase